MVTDERGSGREIATGGLRIDGEPVSIEAHPQPFNNYRIYTNSIHGLTDVQPLIRNDKGIVLRGIKKALRGGHEVTTEVEGEGKSEFTKVGPIVFGFSKHQSLQSIGRFGLNGILGLRFKQIRRRLRQLEEA
jgi:hypothetical protein